MKYPRYDAFRSPFRFGLVCLALWLCSGVASALGLGEIRVISRPGEPLIAQIPIVSSAMGELEQAHVGLASDDVFQRVGVDPPDALVRGLQFTFAKDAHDHALIWVTSQAPINQRAINFLIALEWPQGRLVREYTALVDTPVTFASEESPAPVIDGPDAATVHSPAVEREPPSGVAKGSVPDQVIGAVRPPPPIPLPPPADAARVPLSPAVASPVVLPAAGEPLLTVEKGQTLSEIAQDVADASGSSLNQAMLALLQANPKAFIHGNVNALKQGAILRTPRHNDFERYSVTQARAMIRQQRDQWRQARAPLPQPADDGHRSLPEQERSRPAAAAVADHDRLEIATTVTRDLHQNRGAVSGTSASGEGDMQDAAQLQQAHEDLASRQIEIQELHSRIDELERLKQKQEHLLQLKDSALAEATLQLAKQNAQQTRASANMPWIGIAEASSLIAMAAIIAWLIARRASRLKTADRISSLPLNRSEGAVAGEMRHALDAKGGAGVATDWVAATSGKEATGKARRIGFTLFKRLARTRTDEAPSDGHQHADAEVPKWAASSSQWMAFAPQRAARVVKPSPASQQHDSAVDDRSDTSAPSSAAVVTPPPVEVPLPAAARTPQRGAERTDVDSAKVRDRLELARAYLELGDRTTAKMLLDEVMSSDDHKVRSDAIELSKQLS